MQDSDPVSLTYGQLTDMVDRIKAGSVTFKPYPSTVNTSGTTAQFIASIQALNAGVGMAYLGTVTLSDLPGGLIQEEVEAYVYDDNLIYCICRSADTAPYSWWCASYRYAGWQPTNTTYSAFAGATAQQAGTAGLVPAPTTSDPDKFLKGDGTWGTPTNTTYSDFTGTDGTSAGTSGLVPAPTTSDPDKFLKGDGTWGTPTNTTYSDFTGTDGTSAGTSGLVPAPATTDAGKFLKADGTWGTAGGGGPTVVQTTGASTTDVMSQNATTSMVYADGSIQQKIRIGNTNNQYGVYDIGIGSNALWGSKVTDFANVGIGLAASPYDTSQALFGTISLGARARATRSGEMNIGTDSTQYGFNSSNYRLISGVYDGQNAHDAATKGQLDTAILNGGTTAPTTATVGAVGTLYSYVDTTGTPTPHLMVCTEVTTSGNTTTYTWTDLLGGAISALNTINNGSGN